MVLNSFNRTDTLSVYNNTKTVLVVSLNDKRSPANKGVAENENVHMMAR